ncbi:diadenylate cyclase [Streptoalloteichus tenebrarius]|uniref:DNA integrity scanning protein DisA n=1 Tax=Streptoalloteichus tenebrarius (strain ATCC 17920 / DSM 40477 / JCM 4838 / CBS 697.72 / NBRC 16177 / NCIMB 11028 / NRRL B-12390 / A12253. 1 / ISP 5477) TaxID=1933 RepID=A0ABT1I3W9_STRSD|nr:DNA integrity scanning diadenylate cyclase DisA [Streptoalloteichus tenebrarius]MCP2262265.1 diadenylate cyclase [Streptoalloteichus tenebrarius]BFF01559.1 DNA integrity scanning diadenylate cyclase DisA [Streptoalloteichus tenebrarius]
MTERAQSELLRTTLARLAPGTMLRDGLERILRGRTGGLIVLGHDNAVESICDGGFRLDVEFSATRLRELSKMDGAVVLSTDATRILRANVQLVPDPTIPTEESGTRHRTAERTAIQTGHPVISVSQSMSIISVYVDGRRHVLTDSATILSRANQALATLERYKARLDEVTQALSALEIEDFVTLKDAMTVSQRLEMVRRIADEIDGHVVELGVDGRLIELQLDELVGGVELDRELLVRDYLPEDGSVAEVVAALDELDGTQLLDVASVARAFGFPGTPESLDEQVSPRGYRLLARVPRLPGPVQHRLVEHFGSLQALLAATADDLRTVEGVGDTRARIVREGLSRMAETSIVDRYG